LFLDELNACTQEVQKAFYSLIHERRIGEYVLPGGSIVIGAGNRAQDSAIVKPMSSALLNRMVHVELRVSHREWLAWAHGAGIHPMVIEYIQNRPDHLWSQPPKTEEAFSTPRSWHMLSDALHGFGAEKSGRWIESAAFACLTPAHAGQFKAFSKQVGSRYQLAAILRGDVGWPREPEERDVLYFLAQSLRARLIKELPGDKGALGGEKKELAHHGKRLIKDLATISFEMAQLVASAEGAEQLPAWFMVEIVRDLPRLAEKRDGKA
jgi:MoxR-like ATPase